MFVGSRLRLVAVNDDAAAVRGGGWHSYCCRVGPCISMSFRSSIWLQILLLKWQCFAYMLVLFVRMMSKSPTSVELPVHFMGIRQVSKPRLISYWLNQELTIIVVQLRSLSLTIGFKKIQMLNLSRVPQIIIQWATANNWIGLLLVSLSKSPISKIDHVGTVLR